MHKTLGIIGGGQLALMLIQSASKYGIDCICLDPDPNAPAFKYATKIINSSYGDLKGLKELESLSDVIIYEFENVKLETLIKLDQEKLYQGIDVLYYSQNRIREKKKARENGFKTVDFKNITCFDDLEVASHEIGYPAIIKTCELGYDGKGQMVIHGESDLIQARELLKVPCIYEKKLEFDYEISVCAVANKLGDVAVMPVVKNAHIDGILHTSKLLENEVEQSICKQAQELVKSMLKQNDFCGIICVEFFVKDKEIYFNEMAPRPHNSYHVTMDATSLSQFDLMIRAVNNFKLSDPKVVTEMVMFNVLGQHLAKAVDFAKNNSDVNLYVYGKKDVKHNRKMGHINVKNDLDLILRLRKEVYDYE